MAKGDDYCMISCEHQTFDIGLTIAIIVCDYAYNLQDSPDLVCESTVWLKYRGKANSQAEKEACSLMFTAGNYGTRSLYEAPPSFGDDGLGTIAYLRISTS